MIKMQRVAWRVSRRMRLGVTLIALPRRSTADSYLQTEGLAGRRTVFPLQLKLTWRSSLVCKSTCASRCGVLDNPLGPRKLSLLGRKTPERGRNHTHQQLSYTHRLVFPSFQSQMLQRSCSPQALPSRKMACWRYKGWGCMTPTCRNLVTKIYSSMSGSRLCLDDSL